jgi:catechol 2,3-dioxygenase-like lactoylglutathione lyase family enzyme
MATNAAPAVKGVHHSAFRCRDAEETRAFYEGVLGLPLKAALTFEKDPGGQDRPYMHLFFQFGDGNYIAFFDLPHTVDQKKFRVKDGMEDYHVAMEVGSYDDLLAFKRRLEAHQVPVFGPIDHHFCHSIYFFDPNGVNLEFTVRDARHDAIMAEEAADAGRLMAEWKARMSAVRDARLSDGAAHRKAQEDLKAFIAKAAQGMLDKAAGAGD